MWNLPFALWLLRDAMAALPRFVEDQATVDGASEIQTLRHVTAPLVGPAVVTTALFAFINTWNEFFFALILIADETKAPLSLMVVRFIGVDSAVRLGPLAAASMLCAIPSVVAVPGHPVPAHQRRLAQRGHGLSVQRGIARCPERGAVHEQGSSGRLGVVAGDTLCRRADAAMTTDDSGTVELSFVSLAWQPPAIEANKEIVAEWNASHPDVHVRYVQGDWSTIADQLTVQFQAGKAPDLFHYYDAGLARFAADGRLLDLSSQLSESFVSDIASEAWKNVEFRDLPGRYGVPFLQEPTMIYVNADLAAEHGITLPDAATPWSWDQLRDAALELTTHEAGKPDTFGFALPLKGGAVDYTLTLGMSFDAGYFTDDGLVSWGPAEDQVPSLLHAMIHEDGSMSADVLGLDSVDLVPRFVEGQYAMIVGGAFLRQQLEQADQPTFSWEAIPPPVGTAHAQNNSAQTISISAATKHPPEAAAFLEFFLDPDNQARLAVADWLTPTSQAAVDTLASTEQGLGWDAVLAEAPFFRHAAFNGVTGYSEWDERVASQALRDYYADKISLEELAERVEHDGNAILERATR